MNSKVNRREWKRLRLRALDRDNWQCQKCGRRGRGRTLEVDHVISVAQGGAANDLNNLQTLCAFPCHADKTRAENSRSDNGWGALVERVATDGV